MYNHLEYLSTKYKLDPEQLHKKANADLVEIVDTTYYDTLGQHVSTTIEYEGPQD